MESKVWKISVKGYNAQIFQDTVLKKKYQDVFYGYGFVMFKGTEDECGEFEMQLFNKGFKILGSAEHATPQDIAAQKKAFKVLVDRAYKNLHDLMDWNERHRFECLDWNYNKESRNYTTEELKAKAVADRLWSYYIKKYVTPYI